MNEVIYTDANGNTKYYQSYQSAWKAAARLNFIDKDNLWLFEQDMTGWYVFHDVKVGE
jgi:hypothetical protein